MEKKERVNLIDILITSLNFIVMIVVAISVFSNVLLTSLCLFSSVVLFGLTLVNYFQKNPYYIISSYGIVVCALFFVIGSLFFNNLTYGYTESVLLVNTFLLTFYVITIILDVYFIGRVVKVPEGSWRVKNPRIAYGSPIEPNPDVPRYIKETYEPLGYNKTDKAVNLKQKSAIRKKYHVRLIVLITLISTCAYFLTIILSIL